MTRSERMVELLNTAPPRGETIDWVAERFLNAAAEAARVNLDILPRGTDPEEWWVRVEVDGEVRYAGGATPRRLFRVLADRLAMKAAEESGRSRSGYGDRLAFAPTVTRGPVEVEFENTSRAQRLTAGAAGPRPGSEPRAARGGDRPEVLAAGG